MTGFWIGVAVSILTGTLVNEFCDVSPWLARKLIRRAARLRDTGGSELARGYEVEWAAVIEDCPGKITKVVLALRFLADAMRRAEFGRLRQQIDGLRDRVGWLCIDNPDDWHDGLPAILGPSSALAAVAGVISLSTGLNVIQSLGVSAAVFGVIVACFAGRLTEAAARYAEKTLGNRLRAELQTASANAKLHGDAELWIQVIGDDFVIMRCPAGRGIEGYELWDPEATAFVSFLDTTVVPSMRLGYLRLISGQADTALWRILMQHTGLGRPALIHARTA